MHPSRHPIIEAITRPFAGNAEIRFSAARILEEHFDQDDPGISEAIKRLDARDRSECGWFRKSFIWMLTAAVMAFAIWSEAPAIRTWLGLGGLMYGQGGSPSLPPHLTAKQKFLLGDPRMDPLTQKQLLFESDPDNPAYFAEYAQAYFDRHGTLPDDVLETASRIDPDNSFFLYWAAGGHQQRAIEQVHVWQKRTGARPPAPRYADGVRLRPLPVEQEFLISDQTAYDEALHLIARARRLNKFDSYSITLMKERMRLFPRPRFLTDYPKAVACQFGATSNGLISLRRVANLLNARAEELSKKGDATALIDLAKDRDACVEQLLKSDNGSLVEALVYQVVASATATNFHAAAERLGLTELEEKYRKENEAFIAESDRRSIAQSAASPTLELIEQKSGMLHRLALPLLGDQVKQPPPLTDADLKPMRMAEHELFGRLGVISVGLCLLLGALLVFLFRFLASRSIRLTAGRFASLLHRSDWLWITGLGVGVPILIFFYLSRVSPVSGREYGAGHFLFLFPGLHLTLLLLSLLFVPAVITRWRLKRRAGAFRLGSRRDWLAWPVILLMMIASVAAYPVLVKFNINPCTQIVLAIPLVGWLGVVFFHAGCVFLGSARARILQIATAGAVLPAYALSAMALCSLIPIYRAAESYWVPKDQLILIDPDAPDLGAYEFKVAAQKRRETMAILGIE